MLGQPQTPRTTSPSRTRARAICRHGETLRVLILEAKAGESETHVLSKKDDFYEEGISDPDPAINKGKHAGWLKFAVRVMVVYGSVFASNYKCICAV